MMSNLETGIYKTIGQTWPVVGGFIGWLIGEFKPTFPLIIIAIIFIVYDTWTAYQLDKRVKEKYPDKATRDEAKFTSFAFGKIIRETIPKRLWLIILAYLVEHWVFIMVSLHLSYIVTGVICLEQFVSIVENEISCRPPKESLLWQILKKILKDKTERHLPGIDIEELARNDNDE